MLKKIIKTKIIKRNPFSKTIMKEIEIMAPAGSYESLQAAIKAGAGSVYFGVGKLNMRARAANFQVEDLPKIAKICNENNVKSYLTINTVVYDQEFEDLKKLCDLAKEANVSAVIAMDMSVINYARSIGLEVHMSTQTNISNIEAVKFYAQFADVIVLARELTIEQIKDICEQIQKQDIRGPKGNLIKIEIFIHGALCVSISGKCYMSLSQYNHSANRGDCLQACRRSYNVKDAETGDELEVDNEFIMSPKDLCTIGGINNIIDSGAKVLKIEGRGRSPDYVYTVVKTYKEAIESALQENFSPEKVSKWLEELKTVFNRGFWLGGYYMGKKTGEWCGVYGSKTTKRKIFLGICSNYYSEKEVGEFELQSQGFEVDDELLVTGPTTGVLKFKAESIHNDKGEVEECKKGEVVTVNVPEKTRKNDKLYKLEKK
jgi:putative protease